MFPYLLLTVVTLPHYRYIYIYIYIYIYMYIYVYIYIYIYISTVVPLRSDKRGYKASGFGVYLENNILNLLEYIFQENDHA